MNQKPHRTSRAKSNRRQLRRASTKPEQLMWAVLRNRRLEGLKFRRQHSIGNFIVDFICLEHRLIIELDGGYHDHIYDADRDRQRFLENEGYRVVRFANEDVLQDVEAIAVAIRRIIDEERRDVSHSETDQN